MYITYINIFHLFAFPPVQFSNKCKNYVRVCMVVCMYRCDGGRCVRNMFIYNMDYVGRVFYIYNMGDDDMDCLI